MRSENEPSLPGNRARRPQRAGETCGGSNPQLPPHVGLPLHPPLGHGRMRPHGTGRDQMTSWIE